MSEITFFDIASKGNVCWSYNLWRTRLVLNYKKLDYKTEWVEYPDIAATLSPHVVPHGPGDCAYTLPAIRTRNIFLMDSASLASYLEGQHPSPSLHFSPMIQEVQQMTLRVMKPTRAVWLPLVSKNLLNPSSKEYFDRTRSEDLGQSLEAFQKEQGGEEAWIDALPGLKAFGELLGKEEGPFIKGNVVSYADFIILSWLQFFKTIDEDLLKRVVDVEPTLGRLYDAAKPWLARAD